MALGEQIALEALEPSNRLPHQPANLGEVSRDRKHFASEAFLNRLPDALGDRRLELRCPLGERLEPVARALERCLERRGLGTPFAGSSEAVACAPDRVLIHAPQG